MRNRNVIECPTPTGQFIRGHFAKLEGSEAKLYLILTTTPGGYSEKGEIKQDRTQFHRIAVKGSLARQFYHRLAEQTLMVNDLLTVSVAAQKAFVTERKTAVLWTVANAIDFGDGTWLRNEDTMSDYL